MVRKERREPLTGLTMTPRGLRRLWELKSGRAKRHRLPSPVGPKQRRAEELGVDLGHAEFLRWEPMKKILVNEENNVEGGE